MGETGLTRKAVIAILQGIKNSLCREHFKAISNGNVVLKLQYGRCDSAFYDSNGNIAAIDTNLLEQHVGLVVRKDLLEMFIIRMSEVLTQKDYNKVRAIVSFMDEHGKSLQKKPKTLPGSQL